MFQIFSLSLEHGKKVIHVSSLTRDSSIHYRQIHVSYVKRETFGCIVQNMIESLISSPEDRDFFVTACKILSGRNMGVQ